MKVLYAFLLFLAALVFDSCGSNEKSISPGSTAIITQKCLSATTQDHFDTLNKVSVRKDEPALMKMIANKTVYVIPNNTVGTIREVKFGKYLFECTLNGENLRLWVSSEFLK